MISSEAAALSLSLAQGAFKLAGRMDRLMAEKDAVTGALVLPVPSLTIGPSGIQMVNELRDYLLATTGQIPDPLESDREQMNSVLEMGEPDPEQVEKWFKKYFPDKAVTETVDPDSAFYRALQKELPSIDWGNDGNRLAAFYISAGKEDAELSYSWRLALLITDVLAEFGAENASLIFHDRKARPIVESLLQHFSSPDLEDFTAWSPLLRHTLGATLNGLMDSRDAWQGENVWVNAVLNALSTARAKAGDNYLLGLVQGNGYRLLISEGLSEATQILSADGASEFEQIAADVLTEAVPLVEANEGNFRTFFQEHWGDLLRAGLFSFEKHGPTVLVDTSPLLRDTLLAMVRELAQTGNKELISSETLYNLTDAAIGAVAQQPELITEDIHKAWLKELVTSVTLTLGEQGIRKSLSRNGLEAIINNSLQSFADQPELIVKEPGLLQSLVGSVLSNVGTLSGLDAEQIATASVEGALDAVADNPTLLGTKYAEFIAAYAGRLAEKVSKKQITGLEAADIAAAAAETITLNPNLYLEAENRINTLVLDTVTRVAGDSQSRLLAGATLVATTQELMDVLARYGQKLIGDGPVDSLGPVLFDLVEAGLARAEVEIGQGLVRPALPTILAKLVVALANGDLDKFDPQDERFKAVFVELSQLLIV